MRQFRFRVVLPIAMGFLALVLFGWDYQNNRVVESMGMGWDTGPPMWPYRVVPLFSYAVNVPAYIVSWPILKALKLQTLALEYAVLFPAIVVLWWWVGIVADFGMLGLRSSSRPKLRAMILLTCAIGLVAAAGIVGFREYHCFELIGSLTLPFIWLSFFGQLDPCFGVWLLLLCSFGLQSARFDANFLHQHRT